MDSSIPKTSITSNVDPCEIDPHILYFLFYILYFFLFTHHSSLKITHTLSVNQNKKEKNILSIGKKFVLLHSQLRQKGRLAEGLGTGLQNLLLRFKSGSDLQKRDIRRCLFFYILLRKRPFRQIGKPNYKRGQKTRETAKSDTILQA